MFKKCMTAVLSLLLFCGGCAGEDSRPSAESGVSGASQISESAASLPVLEVTVLDIGKADAILLQAGEEAVLIDTGEEEDGDKVAAALKERGVQRLDCLVLTHLDKDHIGGVPAVLEAVEVERVVQSNNEEDSDAYRACLQACWEAGHNPERVAAPGELPLSHLRLRLLPSGKVSYADDNHYSIMAELTYGEKRFLFAGDAEAERLEEYLAGEPAPVDFLKVPHHGRENDKTAAFLAQVRPAYAVITCSKKHQPDEEVLEQLSALGASVFLTTGGDVRAVCDGQNLTVTQE